jgi:hypothetical protein
VNYIIGVDFDNTIVNYDHLIHSVAAQRGLIHPGVRKIKKHIRDTIRRLPDGEIEWQRLQAIVYGPRMGEARLIEGVRTFFELCKQHEVAVYVVSHKTEYAGYDETGTNLRTAALTWMRGNGFFEADGLGLSRNAVYFEATRREKIERIKTLGCTHFIDDLEETFLETSFPTTVEKILYAPHTQHSSLQRVRVVNTWGEISDYFFGARN